MAKWLDKYDTPKAQNGIEGTMGGLTDKGFNYNGAWGGPSMQLGGNLQPPMAGAVQTLPMYQMGGYVYPTTFVPQAEMGTSLPGSVGFTYARTKGIPSEGPYGKKTVPSAQRGVKQVVNIKRPTVSKQKISTESAEDAKKLEDFKKALSQQTWQKGLPKVEPIKEEDPRIREAREQVVSNLPWTRPVSKKPKEVKEDPWYTDKEPNMFGIVDEPVSNAMNSWLINTIAETVEEQLPYVAAIKAAIALNEQKPLMAASELFKLGANPVGDFMVNLFQSPPKLPEGDYKLNTPFPMFIEDIEKKIYAPHKPTYSDKRDIAEKKNGGEMSFYQNGLDWTPRNISKNGSVVKDNMGYWNPDNWGKVVEIDSPNITMQGVTTHDLLGISDTGDVQYMEREKPGKPGKNYKFKGKKVKEYPVGKYGVNQQDEKTVQHLDQLLNFTNKLKAKNGWLSKYE